PMARYLGIDYGQKRIGVAVSDEDGVIAFPLCVIENSGPQRVLAEIRRIIKEKTPNGIVVGMPLSLDGSKGIAAVNVERFVEIIKEHINITVDVWDERLSTRMAERAMIDGGLSRKRRKQSIDQAAAQLILQSYLDARGGQKASE
ncbi:MAG: Holliday junction resolvase RuvX, partial [Kiritimatiellia bacterium]|nr:Holliday junction resolvase RuvX [Kiritimatiellia bacterium]